MCAILRTNLFCAALFTRDALELLAKPRLKLQFSLKDPFSFPSISKRGDDSVIVRGNEKGSLHWCRYWNVAVSPKSMSVVNQPGTRMKYENNVNVLAAWFLRNTHERSLRLLKKFLQIHVESSVELKTVLPDLLFKGGLQSNNSCGEVSK